MSLLTDCSCGDEWSLQSTRGPCGRRWAPRNAQARRGRSQVSGAPRWYKIPPHPRWAGTWLLMRTTCKRQHLPISPPTCSQCREMLNPSVMRHQVGAGQCDTAKRGSGQTCTNFQTIDGKPCRDLPVGPGGHKWVKTVKMTGGSVKRILCRAVLLSVPRP